ncbi:MAG: DALR anticodon-binding domain-containing protein, partial [Ferruginibacter sp.]
SFYTEHSIANAETEEKKQMRLQLSSMTANVIKSGMQLLGIQVPERM